MVAEVLRVTLCSLCSHTGLDASKNSQGNIIVFLIGQLSEFDDANEFRVIPCKNKEKKVNIKK